MTTLLSTLAGAEFYGLKLRLACDMGRFPSYREAVRGFLARHLEDATTVDDLVVVLDEAWTNVARHSYAGDPDGVMRLELRLERRAGERGPRLTVILRDRGAGGRGFSPARRMAEHLARLGAGEPAGYGLLLLHQMMDEVAYASAPRGENRLVLKKRLEVAWEPATCLEARVPDAATAPV